MSSISDRLGVSKSELLDPTSSDAAIKQAHAETHIIQETKSYFSANGVDLDAFKKRERGDTTILVKNFSYGTKSEELKLLFETHGSVSRILMPPSGTIAIIEFEHADHARSAFGGLAYRKFKDSILFLEKAPRDLISNGDTRNDRNSPITAKTKSAKPLTTELLEDGSVLQSVNSSTLFVRNLNFSTTTERLREVFRPLDGFISARVKTKPDPKKPGQVLSMGFGFLEFRSKSQAQAALAAMDGYKLEGHELLIKASHRAIDAAEERRNEDHDKKIAGRRTKIIIKNLPFEASKKDVRSLFSSYGQLRSVRVPKKFDSSTRGFAFADFVTAREAENAMDALKNTHLLGRRLVLDFAAEDAIDPEQEIEKMQKKVGSQADKVALQRLTGSGRKKFNIQGSEEIDNE
jgi:multiple RNA-binding domain-containing protein 1